MHETDHEVATVSLTALAPFIRLLEESGPQPLERAAQYAMELLAKWGIDRGDLEADATNRLPHELCVELLLGFIDVLGDRAAPLRAGMKLQRGDYELLEYLCGTCKTLGDSIQCLSHYYPLLIDAALTLAVVGERAETRLRIASGLSAPNAMYEFGLASNFAMSILHVELEGAVPPLEICFTHPAPSHSAVFAEVFGAPVRFECEHNAIVFPTVMLQQPLRGADPVLHAVLTRLADHELAMLPDRSAFPARVRAAIESELTRGAPLTAVAQHLHMSVGALRSRLRQHGLTHSELLDRVRCAHAKRALRDSQLAIGELAQRLGFAHPPAFHRAFRRWFGVTPSAYREVKSAHPAARFWRAR